MQLEYRTRLQSLLHGKPDILLEDGRKRLDRDKSVQSTADGLYYLFGAFDLLLTLQSRTDVEHMTFGVRSRSPSFVKSSES